MVSEREDALDLITHGRVVVIMRGPRRRDPSIWIELAKVEPVPRLLRQLFKIVDLCAAVTFAEGMDIVHIALYPSGRRCESRPATPDALGGPLGDKSPLRSVKQFRGGDPKLVAEDRGTRVSIWIVTHSVARVPTLDRT
jgi:hypothetical protein